MGKTRKQPASAGADSGSAKKTRAAQQQPGIAAALAAQGLQATTELVLEQPKSGDLLDRRLMEDLAGQGDKYLRAWGDKSYELRDEAAGSRSGGLRSRPAAAKHSAEENDLDCAAQRFLDTFRHVQQQAFKHEASLDARHLEVLVIMLRNDVMHTWGDASYQAYSLLASYLQRFPYATLGYHEGGEFAGRPFLLIDQQAAWQPLEAASNSMGLTRKYILEELTQDAGRNFRQELDDSSASLHTNSRKKAGQLHNVFELLNLCFDRAVRAVDEDYNGDMLLLRYLLVLLQQDLQARMAVFNAYADIDSKPVQRRRAAVLQNALLWRIYADMEVDDKVRQELVRRVMQLIVGVGSEEELQDVEEQQHPLDRPLSGEGEQASPCICTPRELAAQAACFLNMALDMFGAAEAAGGFHPSSPCSMMLRKNMRLKMDQPMKDVFWKNATEAVCVNDDMSRTFLAALAPHHRLRLLSLVAMERVGKAYNLEQTARHPAVHRAKELCAMVETADSGEFTGAFDADPVVAMQCLNLDKSRSIKVFTNASGDSAVNNLAVLTCGIALAAHSLVAAGGQLMAGGCSGGSGACSPAGRQQLQREVQEFLKFLADKHKENRAAGKKERAAYMSRASLFDLVHAQAAITALG